MYHLIKKIIKTPSPTISKDEFLSEHAGFEVEGFKLKREIHKRFARSLAIREVDAGSGNAEEHELTALSNPYYDIERFGIHFVASPRHADMLFVTGPVSRNMRYALISTYEATPEPRIVVAVGDDAISGGIFKGSYAVLDGVRNVIPVDFEIPGDPPSPKVIVRALLHIIDVIGSRKGYTKNL